MTTDGTFVLAIENCTIGILFSKEQYNSVDFAKEQNLYDRLWLVLT